MSLSGRGPQCPGPAHPHPGLRRVVGIPRCPPVPPRVPPPLVFLPARGCRNSRWPLASSFPRNEEGPGRSSPPPRGWTWGFPAPTQLDPRLWGPPLSGCQAPSPWGDPGVGANLPHPAMDLGAWRLPGAPNPHRDGPRRPGHPPPLPTPGLRVDPAPGCCCGWTQASGCWLPINRRSRHKGTHRTPRRSPHHSHGGRGAAPSPRPPAAALGPHPCPDVSQRDPPPHPPMGPSPPPGPPRNPIRPSDPPLY